MKLHDWQAMERKRRGDMPPPEPPTLPTIFCAECKLRFQSTEELIQHTKCETHRKTVRKRLGAVAQ